MNPQRVRDFGRSEGQRTKTDKADAALIARFCSMHDPAPWSPPRAELFALQPFVRPPRGSARYAHARTNRLSGPITDELVRKSMNDHLLFLNAHIADIEKQIDDLIDNDTNLRNQRDLIKNIPGLQRSATSITAEFHELAQYRDAKAVAAHAAYAPQSNNPARPSHTAISAARAARNFGASSTFRRSSP